MQISPQRVLLCMYIDLFWVNTFVKCMGFFVNLSVLLPLINSDVNAYRLELEGITVKGKGCPKPIKTWVQCGVSMKILSALKK